MKVVRKKVILLGISLAVAISLLSNVVFAQVIQMPQILTDLLTAIFQKLPAGVQQGDAVALIYFKLLLWFLLFAAALYGSRRVFQEENSSRIATTIAALFAAIGVMFIPNGMLQFIASEYALVGGLIIIIAPILAAWAIASKVPDDMYSIKGLIFLFVALLLFTVAGYLTAYAASSSSAPSFIPTFAQWTSFAAIVAGLFGLSFLLGFGAAGGMHLGSRLFGGGDRDGRQNTPGITPPGSGPDPQSEAEAAAQADQAAEHQEEIANRVTQALNQCQQLLDRIDGLLRPVRLDTDAGRNRAFNHLFERETDGQLTDPQIEYLDDPERANQLRTLFNSYLEHADYLLGSFLEMSHLDNTTRTRVYQLLRNPLVRP